MNLGRNYDPLRSECLKSYVYSYHRSRFDIWEPQIVNVNI